jgi:hypothetical protein
MTEPRSLIAYQLAEREIVADEMGWSRRRTLEKRPAMIEPRSRSGV